MASDDYMDHVMENLEHEDDDCHSSNIPHEMLDICLPFGDDKCSEPRFPQTTPGDEASDASTAATTPPLDAACDATHHRAATGGRYAHISSAGAAKSDSGSSPATPSTAADGGGGGGGGGRPPVECPQTTTVADSGGLFEAYCRAGAPVTSPYLQQHQITRRRSRPPVSSTCSYSICSPKFRKMAADSDAAVTSWPRFRRFGIPVPPPLRAQHAIVA